MSPGEDARPRRFYVRAAAAATAGGWRLELDGRPVRTPQRRELVVPGRALAEALAAEWEAQGERVDMASMHVTRLANVALDRAEASREAMAGEAARYAGTDLLCHLADQPAELRARQEAAWAPLRDWADGALGLRLVATQGVTPIAQPAASIAAAAAAVRGLEAFRLAGVGMGLGLFGSVVLALAVERRRLSAREALDLSRIDETFQQEQWGVDDEAAARARRADGEATALDSWFDALASAG